GPIDEVVDGELRSSLAAREEIAHVVADAGQPEQARLLVEHRLDLLRAETEPLEQMEYHAGIERARPRAHAQSVERGEPEAGVDASSVVQRAEACAASQVRDDDASEANLRRHLRQNRGDIFVR